MASSMQMMMIGMKWLVTMAVLGFLTYFGSIFQKVISDFFMSFQFMPLLARDVGTSWWIMPLYYIVILLVALAATYRCYQEVVTTVNYYPEYY